MPVRSQSNIVTQIWLMPIATLSIMEKLMKLLFKSLSAVALSLGVVSVFASPSYLITHNNTDLESNAVVANTPSPYPTPAHSTRQLYWNLVRFACYGHTTDGKCKAMIKVGTNTANPIDIGTVSLDLDTGDISPKVLSANGYTITVNGAAEATISKN